jgi:hypothetical protein
MWRRARSGAARFRPARRGSDQDRPISLLFPSYQLSIAPLALPQGGASRLFMLGSGGVTPSEARFFRFVGHGRHYSADARPSPLGLAVLAALAALAETRLEIGLGPGLR